ncbi:replication restart helicase PriA, partial [Faecalibaculum rodentium]
MNYVKVYVEHSALSLNQLFTYSCDEPVQPGCRVVVPFGPRELTAIVAALAKEPETSRKILPVSQVLDKTPLLNDELFELSGWLSDRCCASVISVLKTMLPPAMRPKTGHSKVVMEQWLEQGIPADGAKLTGKQESFLSGLQLPVPAAQARRISASMTRSLLEKGFLKSVDRPKDRDLITLPAKDVPPELRPGQMQALEQIRQSKASVFLLHGVTGSGKTEVFLRLAQEALEQGRQVLFLVPEIGLTPMMTQRVMARFQDQIAVYHSYLSPQEKYTQYQRVKEGKARIVVGTRSACFMPFDNLGLILMDEEHDASYMQDSMPRYHTRDVVLHRAAHHGCKVVMASATPSLESYARTLKHVYELVQLPERVNFQMPEIRLLDMSKETVRDGFSQTLLDAIKSRLERKEQVILLLNRRGYLPVVRCADCHDVRICPDCGIALSYHKKENRLVCHSCDRSFRYDPVCPACGSTHTAPLGMGTEKLEDTLQTLFPDARILRMDADSTRKKGAHKALLDRFSHGADILVGTQMVAKGLDFPNVTLVGILQADNALIRSDYRAA